MKNEKLIRKCENFVRQQLEGEGSGHDWWHIVRVRNMALNIAAKEGGNREIIELAALLHDIADHKFHNGDLEAGPRVAAEFLKKEGLSEKTVQAIAHIIREVSFKGAGIPDQVSTLEAKIVQDADRLDAIGAIGIARTFAYGGSKNRPLYDPSVESEMHSDFEKYRKSTAPTINHFYEKLLLLKDRMHTASARQIALERHRFMEHYLERFFEEWNAEDYPE